MTEYKKASKKKVKSKKSTDVKKNEIQEPKTTRQLVSGSNALIKVSIFTPDYEPQAYEVVIPEIIHSLPINARTANHIHQCILSALKLKFGLRVK